MTAILIYQTDSWHSTSSFELIGIATTEKKRDTLIRRYLRECLQEKPSRDEIADAIGQVQQIGQTQGLAERYDLEIHTETIETNQLVI